MDHQTTYAYDVLSGASPSFAPPDFGVTIPLIKDQQMPREPSGKVTNETTQAGVSSAISQSYAMGTECCGKDTAKSSGGGTLAEQKTARAGIQQSSEFAKSLLSAGTGALNQLSGPWDAVLDSSGPATQQITIAYYDDGSLERLQERINESLSGISKLLYGGDKSTGKISGVSHDDGSTTSPLADFSYDSYGRLIETTDHSSSPATTTHYHNDWLTGDMNIADDGSSPAAYNHLPGGSRYTIALIPDEWKQKFLLRGR